MPALSLREETYPHLEKKTPKNLVVWIILGGVLGTVVMAIFFGWIRYRLNKSAARAARDPRHVQFEGWLPPREQPPIVPPKPFRGCLGPPPQVQAQDIEMGAVARPSPTLQREASLAVKVQEPGTGSLPLPKPGLPVQRFQIVRKPVKGPFSARSPPPPPIKTGQSTTEPSDSTAEPLRDVEGRPVRKFNSRHRSRNEFSSPKAERTDDLEEVDLNVEGDTLSK